MRGVDVDDGGRVVAEDHVGLRPTQRRLAHERVAREVQAVRLVLDVLVAPKEDGVVEGGGELAGAATDIHRTVTAVQLAADDRPRPSVPFRQGPLAGAFIDGEGLTRHHDRPGDLIGEQLDVDHPVGTARVPCREARHLGDRAHCLGHFSGEGRFLGIDRGNRPPTAGCRRRTDGCAERIDINHECRARRDDGELLGLFIELEDRIDRQRGEVPEPRRHRLGEDDRIEEDNNRRCRVHHRLALQCGGQTRRGEHQPTGGVRRPQHHRASHHGACLLDGGVHIGVVHLGDQVGERQRDHLHRRCGQARDDQRGGPRAINPNPGLGIFGGRDTVDDNHGTFVGRLVDDVAVPIVEDLIEERVVDGDRHRNLRLCEPRSQPLAEIRGKSPGASLAMRGGGDRLLVDF